MTDICKCNNMKCALRQTCFRALATASEYQAYFIMEEKEIQTPEECGEYWDCPDEETRQKYQRYWDD